MVAARAARRGGDARELAFFDDAVAARAGAPRGLGEVVGGLERCRERRVVTTSPRARRRPSAHQGGPRGATGAVPARWATVVHPPATVGRT